MHQKMAGMTIIILFNCECVPR